MRVPGGATSLMVPKRGGRVRIHGFLQSRDFKESLTESWAKPARARKPTLYCKGGSCHNTGVSELCDLDLDDLKISPKKGMLTLRQGKGEKKRQVPANVDARNAVSEWLELRGHEPDPLFTGRRGDSRLTPSGVHRRVVELGKIKGLEIHAHTLRHTFAKDLLDAGVPLTTISKLLGHSKVETTKIYTMPGERDLENAVDKVAWV